MVLFAAAGGDILRRDQQSRLGAECIGIDELPCTAGAPSAGGELTLLWHRAVHRLDA